MVEATIQLKVDGLRAFCAVPLEHRVRVRMLGGSNHYTKNFPTMSLPDSQSLRLKEVSTQGEGKNETVI